MHRFFDSHHAAMHASLWMIAALWTSPARAFAQRPLTFAQVTSASVRGPRVVAMENAIQVRTEEDRAITGLPSNPQIQVMPGVRVAPGDERGFEIQATLTQSIALSPLGSRRQEAAERERDELHNSRAAAALETRLGGARVWIELFALTQQQQIAERELRTADETLHVLRQAVAAGERTGRDEAALEAYLEEVRLDLVALETRRRLAGVSLASIVFGEGEATTAGELPSVRLPNDEELDHILDDVGGLPAVAQSRLAALSSRARAAESFAASSSQLQLGVSAQFDQPGGFVVFGVVGFQPRLVDTGARARSVQLAEAARQDGEYEQALREGRRFVHAARIAMQQAQAHEESLRTRLLPAAQRFFELETQAFEARESSLIRVLDARGRVLAGRRRLAEAQGQRTWAEVKIWLLWAAIHPFVPTTGTNRGESPSQ